MSARSVGVRGSPAATADSAVVNASSTKRWAARHAETWSARPFWKVGRLASDAMSLIRYLVAASAATSSSMLLATPSAHDAWPAAVTGISPIRVAGELPRYGVLENSGKVRLDGTKTSSTP